MLYKIGVLKDLAKFTAKLKKHKAKNEMKNKLNKIIFKYYWRNKTAKLENECKYFFQRKNIKILFE